MRRLLAALVLGLAGGLFALAAVEVALRLGGFARQFITPDRVIGYRLTPDFSRSLTEIAATETVLRLSTNNLGLRRDQPTAVHKPAGTARVLVLGDSQTEGIVENRDGYPALLESSLAVNGAVEVLNAGVSGYSPLLEYLWLREWGVRLEPDIAVLALYTGNDLGELTASVGNFAGLGPWSRLATMRREATQWAILRPGAPDLWPETDSWLRATSRAYDLVRSRMRGPESERIEAIGAAVQQCPGCLQSLWQAWMSQERPSEYAEASLRLREVLSRFRAFADEIHARPLALLLPTKLDVEPETVRNEVEKTQATLGLRMNPTAFALSVRAQMLAACAAQKVEVIDLLPALRAARERDGQELFWVLDWHLNPAGNRAVAAAVEPRLAALLRSR